MRAKPRDGGARKAGLADCRATDLCRAMPLRGSESDRVGPCRDGRVGSSPAPAPLQLRVWLIARPPCFPAAARPAVTRIGPGSAPTRRGGSCQPASRAGPPRRARDPGREDGGGPCAAAPPPPSPPTAAVPRRQRSAAPAIGIRPPQALRSPGGCGRGAGITATAGRIRRSSGGQGAPPIGPARASPRPRDGRRRGARAAAAHRFTSDPPTTARPRLRESAPISLPRHGRRRGGVLPGGGARARRRWRA